MSTKKDDLREAADELRAANFILIGAGAGMSVDAGYPSVIRWPMEQITALQGRSTSFSLRAANFLEGA